MLVVTLTFVWGTTYLMARAIRREAQISRLQSDFVAAVSHEFRSPLTTLRQVTEMLESDRLPGTGAETRRKAYYSLLVGETTRLQRLVETLFNFGHMEAGAAQYRFDEGRSVGHCTETAARDLERKRAAANMSIDDGGENCGLIVRADETALVTAHFGICSITPSKYSAGAVRWCVSTWVRVNDRVAHSRSQIRRQEFRRRSSERFSTSSCAGETAIRANVRGTGVGLAMVQRDCPRARRRGPPREPRRSRQHVHDPAAGGDAQHQSRKALTA